MYIKTTITMYILLVYRFIWTNSFLFNVCLFLYFANQELNMYIKSVSIKILGLLSCKFCFLKFYCFIIAYRLIAAFYSEDKWNEKVFDWPFCFHIKNSLCGFWNHYGLISQKYYRIQQNQLDSSFNVAWCLPAHIVKFYNENQHFSLFLIIIKFHYKANFPTSLFHNIRCAYDR